MNLFPLLKCWFRAFNKILEQKFWLFFTKNKNLKQPCMGSSSTNRSSLLHIVLKKVFLKISQISQENTCVWSHLSLRRSLLLYKAVICKQIQLIRFWNIELDLQNRLKLFLSNLCKIKKSRICFGCYPLCFIFSNGFWTTKNINGNFFL